VEQIETALRGTDLDPRLLEIGITEGLAMENAATTIDTLRAVKKLGVRSSIDDFGTGYSSLLLSRASSDRDILEIDRPFVRELHDNQADAAIAATVIAMGRPRGLRCSPRESSRTSSWPFSVGSDAILYRASWSAHRCGQTGPLPRKRLGGCGPCYSWRRCFAKKSSVRCQASFAASSS
jgi:hypothetical protein